MFFQGEDVTKGEINTRAAYGYYCDEIDYAEDVDIVNTKNFHRRCVWTTK